MGEDIISAVWVDFGVSASPLIKAAEVVGVCRHNGLFEFFVAQSAVCITIVSLEHQFNLIESGVYPKVTKAFFELSYAEEAVLLEIEHTESILTAEITHASKSVFSHLKLFFSVHLF